MDAVGSGDPVGDFRSMIAAGAVEGALSGMQATIISLVKISTNEGCGCVMSPMPPSKRKDL